MDKKLNNNIIELIKNVIAQNDIITKYDNINFNSEEDFYVIFDIKDVNAYTSISDCCKGNDQISKYHFMIFFSKVFKKTYKMSLNLDIYYINELEFDEASYQILLSKSQFKEFKNALYNKFIELRNYSNVKFFDEVVNNITKYKYSNKIINSINDL